MQQNSTDTVFTTTLPIVLASHLDSHQTRATDWPADAEFCAVYNSSTWPCGWGKNSYVEFFKNRAELDEFLARRRKWALCEDNYAAHQVYRWDLGPVLMPEFDSNEGHLPWTYAEEERYLKMRVLNEHPCQVRGRRVLRLLEQSAKGWEAIRNQGRPDHQKEWVWNPKPEEQK